KLMGKRPLGPGVHTAKGLERFRNRCIRLVRVVRRFSAAFVAAKRPLKPLRSKTSAALAIFFLPLLRGPKGVQFQEILYTSLSPHSLQIEGCAQRSTAVDRWAARSIPRPQLWQ